MAAPPLRPCGCCGHLTIQDEYDICPVCDWEADDVQEGDADYSGGANDMSLNEAREAYRLRGAKGPGHVDHVRSPQPHEAAERAPVSTMPFTWLAWIAVVGLTAWTVALAAFFGDSWNAVDPGDSDEVMVSEFMRWVAAILWVIGAVVAMVLLYRARTARPD